MKSTPISNRCKTESGLPWNDPLIASSATDRSTHANSTPSPANRRSNNSRRETSRTSKTTCFRSGLMKKELSSTPAEAVACMDACKNRNGAQPDPCPFVPSIGFHNNLQGQPTIGLTITVTRQPNSVAVWRGLIAIVYDAPINRDVGDHGVGHDLGTIHEPDGQAAIIVAPDNVSPAVSIKVANPDNLPVHRVRWRSRGRSRLEYRS